MTRVPLAFLAPTLGGPATALAAGAAAPEGPGGRYESPLGTVELWVEGGAVVGTPVAPVRGSPFTKGDEVLRAMACVRAMQGQRPLALRYLQIAALDGYATAEGIDEDPDLASLHDEPAYRTLVKAHL